MHLTAIRINLKAIQTHLIACQIDLRENSIDLKANGWEYSIRKQVSYKMTENKNSIQTKLILLMKKKNENELVRMNAVLGVFDSFKAEWQSSAPFGECVADLLHLKEKIDTERSNVAKSTEGITKAKQNAETELKRLAFHVSSALAAFAVRSKNEVLLAEIDFNKSDFELMRDNELIATGRKLAEETKLRSEEMNGYGITPDVVTELEVALKQFETLAPAPQRTIGNNKMKREDLDELFRQANTLMREELDRMIVPYESKAVDFYRAYQNARKTVKFGVRHNGDDEGQTPETDL